jgi:hypothetical protein
MRDREGEEGDRDLERQRQKRQKRGIWRIRRRDSDR